MSPQEVAESIEKVRAETNIDNFSSYTVDHQKRVLQDLENAIIFIKAYQYLLDKSSYDNIMSELSRKEIELSTIYRMRQQKPLDSFRN